MRKLWTIGMLAAVVTMVAACSGGGGRDEEGAAGGGGVSRAVEAEDPFAQSDPDEAVAVEAAQDGAGSSLPALGPQVIQTASMRLSVERSRFEESVDAARTIAASVGGFVVGSTASQGRDERLVRGTLVVRVPERSYADVMQRLSRLGRVESRRESGQDVSQEFVDLEARGRHLEAVERQLLTLLEKANTVTAALAVQSQLNEVQLELEQVRGRLHYLRDQVAFATISLDIHERRAAAKDDGDEAAWGITDSWRTAAHGFATVVGWILVVVATAAPLVLLLALAVVAARFAARRGRLAWRKS